MPFPVIAGIPFLAGVIGSLFVSFVNFFTVYFTKKLALVAAALVLIVSLTASFFAGLYVLSQTLVFFVPPSVSLAASLVIPSNATLCLSVIVTARVARWAYSWNVRIIQWKFNF